jgi:hypothetical protein
MVLNHRTLPRKENIESISIPDDFKLTQTNSSSEDTINSLDTPTSLPNSLQISPIHNSTSIPATPGSHLYSAIPPSGGRPSRYARLQTSPFHRNTVVLKTPKHHDCTVDVECGGGKMEQYLQLKWEGLLTPNKVPLFQEYEQADRTEKDLSLKEKLQLLDGKLHHSLRWHANHTDHIAIIILDFPYKPTSQPMNCDSTIPHSLKSCITTP